MIIFASKTSQTIKMEHLEDILKSQINVSFEWGDTGNKNELDFRLIAHLGMFIDINKANYIVSRDNGFLSAVNHIKRKYPNVVLEVIKENQTINSKKKNPMKKTNTRTNKSEEVDNILKVLSSTNLKKRLRKIVQTCLNSKQITDKAKKDISKELRRFRLHGDTYKDIYDHIIDSTTQAISNSNKN